METVVLNAIWKRYGDLTGLYSAMRECEDTVLVNLEDDVDCEFHMYEILDMIQVTINSPIL